MELMKKDMPGDVACLDLLPVPEGRQRAKFLAVGAYDNTVRPQMPACVHAWLFIRYLNCCPSVRAGSSPESWPSLPSRCRVVLIIVFAIALLALTTSSHAMSAPFCRHFASAMLVRAKTVEQAAPLCSSSRHAKLCQRTRNRRVSFQAGVSTAQAYGALRVGSARVGSANKDFMLRCGAGAHPEPGPGGRAQGGGGAGGGCHARVAAHAGLARGRVRRRRHRRGRRHALPAHGCASCLFQRGRQLSRARTKR